MIRVINLLLGSSCNFECKYCKQNGLQFHSANTLDLPVNDNVVGFISRIKTLERIVFSGGEPLLYFDKIKYIVENYYGKEVQFAILTNGYYLDLEKVEFLNKYNFDVMISHDGRETEYLRGCDVFKNHDTVSVVNKINNLWVSSLVCNISNNPSDICSYIKECGITSNFRISFCDLSIHDFNKYLIAGFSFDDYANNLYNFLNEGNYQSNMYITSTVFFLLNKSRNSVIALGCNGDVYSSHITYDKICHIEDVNCLDIIAKHNKNYSNNETSIFCKDCSFNKICTSDPYHSCDHFCKKKKTNFSVILKYLLEDKNIDLKGIFDEKSIATIRNFMQSELPKLSLRC